MSFIAPKALSNPPLQPLCILYDAMVNDPLPSACEGGSVAIIAMGLFAEKAKKSTAKRGTYTTATNLTRWSNTTPQPVWRSVGAVLQLPLEIIVKGGYHGYLCYVGQTQHGLDDVD